MTKYTVKITTQSKKDYTLVIKRRLKIDLLGKYHQLRILIEKGMKKSNICKEPHLDIRIYTQLEERLYIGIMVAVIEYVKSSNS